MRAVIATMGARFSHNLVRHLSDGRRLMRILVLGATGYVGSRLVPALLAAGHDVVAASSSPPDPDRFAWGGEVAWRQCDVTDRRAVERASATPTASATSCTA